MKILRALFALVLVLMLAAAAFANSSTDPKIIVRDPVCSGPCTPVGTHFTFTVPASGTGILLFNNASGVAWTTLRLVESGVAAANVDCQTNVFLNCTVGTLPNGKTFILLSGIGGGFAGITPGENFSITFGCATGVCQPWPGNLPFSGVANVPEPATVALVLTGLGGIVLRRKRLQRAA